MRWRGRWVSGWRRLRLGTQISLLLGVLALVVFGLVGVATVTSMRSYLDRRLDDQLAQVHAEECREVTAGPGIRQVPKEWLAGVLDVGADGTVTPESRQIGLPPWLNATNLAVSASRTGSPVRGPLPAAAGDARYRGMASDLGPGRVLVTAAPVEPLDETVTRLAVVETVTFLAALAVLVGTGGLALRRGLRPLAEVAATAHEISSIDLTGRSAKVGLRAGGSGGGIEVTELRQAFNVMLAHIDSSLEARQRAEERLRRFVADASHELRTPLTSIRGYADLFRYAAANAPEERDAHLARMRDEAERMSLLVDDLLLLARLDAAHPAAEAPLRAERVDLAEIVTAAAEAFRAAHPDHPLTVTSPGDPGPVAGDPMRLRQVLDNLLTNAAVHTPAGTAVGVVLRVEPAAVELAVTDDGPGIPAEAQARVFDRFYRVDDTRVRSATGGGTGLGLAVVRSLVAAHGGTVELASRPGRTAFTVRLPRPS
ncbi:sensor histidine kinase [Gandjariella thermophila]|uniref:histidine kinase n=1 Tax=Gandjariella thermophila TaxID=1931992 RepID=A0A4D4J6Y7_9PSEU|nr:HAMP domain-containing sensor histidine kinase [Gandjariella thermophila]GDY30276.1 two-component sensor histidine kinase [Gandjariella thermophila]